MQLAHYAAFRTRVCFDVGNKGGTCGMRTGRVELRIDSSVVNGRPVPSLCVLLTHLYPLLIPPTGIHKPNVM